MQNPNMLPAKPLELPSAEFLALQAALAGEYSLQRELGRGGMGVVYLARDVKLDRDVAIKMLPLDLARSHENRERFLREARTAAGLSHPHIVPIHRVGDENGVVYFVMSYIEGETLGERLRTRGPLEPAQATRIMREVAWALAYAHGRGIVHRDVKPDNILLEAASGRALVTDFGIAFGGAHAGPNTDPGKITGTLNFMSPEQSASETVDGRSDIYSLGVVGYLAVSGRLPFEGNNVPSFLLRQASQPAPPVLQAAPGLPRQFASVIDRCLARSRDDRFADGEALAAALEPKPDTRAVLPTTLRAWLSADNPLALPYLGFSSMMGVAFLGNLYALLTRNVGSSIGDLLAIAAVGSAPLIPVLGFHLNHARRQFRLGHSLDDLRSAIETAKRERAESENVAATANDQKALHKLLQVGTIATASWTAVMMGLFASGVLNENRNSILLFLAPFLSTLLLGAVSNALDVQFIPKGVRSLWQSGFRDRLWNSRVGEWFARKLGAPDRSQVVDANAFRATEVVLGVAAADLFTALPPAYRDGLADLPATISALEANAAAARAELEMVSAIAPKNQNDAGTLERRRAAASSHLEASVGALERIRIDLLRLHGGAADLQPLTTLIDAARLLSEDINRLADAEREVEAELRRR